MKKIVHKNIVFGASGQDGFFMTRFLLTKGEVVIAVTRKNNFLLNKLKKQYKKKLIVIHLDKIHQKKSLDQIFTHKSIKKIFFCIGYSRIPNTKSEKKKCFIANYFIFKYLLEYLYNNNLFPKILYISSGEIFGSNHITKKNENSKLNPENCYSNCKFKALKLIRKFNHEHNFFISCAICFNHESFLTPKNHLIRKFINLIDKAKTRITIYNKNEKRNFSHVYDFLPIFNKILNQKKPDEYVLANNKNYKILHLVTEIKKLLNKKNIIIDYKYTNNFSTSRMADNKKIVKELGYAPKFDINKLLKEMIFYYRNNRYVN